MTDHRPRTAARPGAPAATTLDELVHESLLDRLGLVGDRAARPLSALQPGLRALRAAYETGEQPDFADPSLRGAYVLASHPHHCIIAAAVLGEIVPTWFPGADGPAGEHTVTVLGAGPGAEAVGLVWALKQAGIPVDTTTIHLVDREPGWAKSRRITLAAIDEILDGEPGPRIEHHVIDLTRPERRLRDLLASSDLVIAQAVYSELAERGAVDHIVDHFTARALFLIVEFPSGRHVVDRLPEGDLRILHRASYSIRPPRAPAVLREHLFADADGLRARSRALDVDARLVGRPGQRLPAPATGAVRPSPDQAAAIAAFTRHLQGSASIFRLRGGAGTGKSALYPALARIAREQGLSPVQLAPTGQAARRLRERHGPPAHTIHAHLFTFDAIETGDDDEAAPRIHFRRRNGAHVPELLFVDEASLIADRPPGPDDELVFGQAGLLTELLAYVRESRSRLVLVGDPHQLPPVGEDEPPAFDDAHLARLGEHHVTDAALETCHRHESTGIARLAHRLLTTAPRSWAEIGAEPDAGIVRLDGTRTGPSGDDQEPLPPWLCQSLLAGDATVVTVTNGRAGHWNRVVRRGLGRPLTTPVAGDRLVVTRSDAMAGFVNGDELEVVAVGEPRRVRRAPGRGRRPEVVVLVPIDARVQAGGLVETVSVELVAAIGNDDLLHAVDNDAHRRVDTVLRVDLIARTQVRPGDPAWLLTWAEDPTVHALRVTYAYARTCHRAQGGEWDDVVVDLTGIETVSEPRRWGYTAVSRARRAVHLFGLPRLQRDPEMTVDDLAAWVTDRLPPGTRVRDTRAQGNGVTVRVTDGNRVAQVVVYLREGRPSTVVAEGRSSPLRDDLHSALTAAVEAEQRRARRRRRLPEHREVVEELASRLAPHDVLLDDVTSLGPYRTRLFLRLDGLEQQVDVIVDGHGRPTAWQVVNGATTPLVGIFGAVADELGVRRGGGTGGER